MQLGGRYQLPPSARAPWFQSMARGFGVWGRSVWIDCTVHPTGLAALSEVFFALPALGTGHGLSPCLLPPLVSKRATSRAAGMRCELPYLNAESPPRRLA
jgi:hypothetical protein